MFCIKIKLYVIFTKRGAVSDSQTDKRSILGPLAIFHLAACTQINIHNALIHMQVPIYQCFGKILCLVETSFMLSSNYKKSYENKNLNSLLIDEMVWIWITKYFFKSFTCGLPNIFPGFSPFLSSLPYILWNNMWVMKMASFPFTFSADVFPTNSFVFNCIKRAAWKVNINVIFNLFSQKNINISYTAKLFPCFAALVKFVWLLFCL